MANGLARQAQGATTQRIKLEEKIAKARLTNSITKKLTIQQVKANRRERGLVDRARDIKILLQWFSHDVLALAGPDLAERQELFDFIEIELKQRAGKQYPSIRKLRKALIVQHFELPLQSVREICLLHRKHETSNAYWERWNQLHSVLSSKFQGG